MSCLVVKAVHALKEGKPPGLDNGRLFAPVKTEGKKAIAELQQTHAIVEFRLREVAAELQEARAADSYAGFSKRWQAHADLVHAIVLGRILLLHECNAALAQVRTDSLPELQPGELGWRLAPAVRLRTLENAYKKMNKTRLALLAEINTTHAATPWAFVAERERFESLGFEWKTFSQNK